MRDYIFLRSIVSTVRFFFPIVHHMENKEDIVAKKKII